MKPYVPGQGRPTRGSPSEMLRIAVTFRRPKDGLGPTKTAARLSAASVMSFARSRTRSGTSSSRNAASQAASLPVTPSGSVGALGPAGTAAVGTKLPPSEIRAHSNQSRARKSANTSISCFESTGRGRPGFRASRTSPSWT